MARKRKAKRDEGGDALALALEALDDVHAKIIALGVVADLEPEATSELTSEDGDKLPQTLFEVGEVDPPAAVGTVMLETRLTMGFSVEQAEALAFELLRAIREDSNQIEIELDGAWMLDRDSARDVQRALKESR